MELILFLLWRSWSLIGKLGVFWLWLWEKNRGKDGCSFFIIILPACSRHIGLIFSPLFSLFSFLRILLADAAFTLVAVYLSLDGSFLLLSFGWLDPSIDDYGYYWLVSTSSRGFHSYIMNHRWEIKQTRDCNLFCKLRAIKKLATKQSVDVTHDTSRIEIENEFPKIWKQSSSIIKPNIHRVFPFLQDREERGKRRRRRSCLCWLTPLPHQPLMGEFWVEAEKKRRKTPSSIHTSMKILTHLSVVMQASTFFRLSTWYTLSQDWENHYHDGHGSSSNHWFTFFNKCLTKIKILNLNMTTHAFYTKIYYVTVLGLSLIQWQIVTIVISTFDNLTQITYATPLGGF